MKGSPSAADTPLLSEAAAAPADSTQEVRFCSFLIKESDNWIQLVYVQKQM